MSLACLYEEGKKVTEDSFHELYFIVPLWLNLLSPVCMPNYVIIIPDKIATPNLVTVPRTRYRINARSCFALQIGMQLINSVSKVVNAFVRFLNSVSPFVENETTSLRDRVNYY